jgi:hypothetical protein
MTPDERRKLVLGMLGSSFDGERATAAAMADKLVRAAGLTWDRVLGNPPAATASTSTSTELVRVDACLAQAERLSA